MRSLLASEAVLISGHRIDHLLGRWGYGLVFAIVVLQSSGVPVPGTTALIAAAIYAATTHRLAIVGVILAAGLGAVVGYSVGFALGRWGGWRMLNRYGHYVRLTPARLKIGRYAFGRHGGKVVFFGRFVTGLRTWAGFLAGANRMALPRFLLFNVAGGVTWALLNGLGYYYFGHALSTASTAVNVMLATAGVVGVAASLTFLRSRGRSLQLAAERAYPDSGDPRPLSEPDAAPSC